MRGDGVLLTLQIGLKVFHPIQNPSYAVSDWQIVI